MTEFYFVRHGETFANAQGLLQGTSDDEITFLDGAGKQQARQLRESFDLSIADRFIISPLNRTQQTAEILNVELQLPLSFDDRLKEISYGAWDGLSKNELQTQYPDAFEPEYNDLVPDYEKIARGGESFNKVIERVGDFLADASEKYPDEKIVVVTHGFTIKAAVINVLNLKDPQIIPEPENLRLTLIRIEGQRAYLDYFNR